jgi:hypothetical protein
VTLQPGTANDADALNGNPASVDTEQPVTSLRRIIQLRMLSLSDDGLESLPLDPLLSCSPLRTFSLRRWAVIWQPRWHMPRSPKRIGLSC